MNILVLNNTSDLYGGSKILSIVVKILAEGKHNPIVILSETGPLAEELERLNVDVRIIRLGILRRKYLSAAGIINRIQVTRKAWKALNQLVAHDKIDLIYSNTTGVFIGAFLARRRKIKHIWHVHEIISKPKAFTSVFGYLLSKYSDKIIVVSEAVKTHWERHVGKKSITRIYNGIDTKPFEQQANTLKEELNIPEDQLLISMIGRVNHWKGQNYFIDIAKNMLKTNPAIRFVIAGDAYPGNEHLVEQLERRLIEEGLHERVFYIGYRTDTPNILGSSDLFVLPSTQPDPFPTVILEAMASGKPIAATRHGGATEMILDGETGILIPWNDAIKAAAQITTLVSDTQKLLIMGQNAHARIHQFYSLPAFRTAILNTFESTLP